MKNFICVIFCVLTFLVGCSHETPSEREIIEVYQDERVKICYAGIIEEEMPWMTERGMEAIIIQSVNLKITNYTSNSFFVSGSTLIVDGVDVSPASASLKVLAESTGDYAYPSESLKNLSPNEIEMRLYIFDIHNPQLFEPYEVTLKFTIEN